MEKPTTHRKKQFVSNAFKYMIAVSSIAGTFGIWNLLANKDLVNANAQNITNGQTATNIDQAPLPTLVPVIKVDLSALKANSNVTTDVQSTTDNTLREVARPTTAPSTASLPVPSLNNPSTNNNNNQGAPAVLPPAPVTTTQSSKP
ncbi:MAG: hypothetical protein ACD_34C00020G0002 [uncultured bacterium]|nr:MAG: hypothetical protein ACD_34C00020G0002 [uncultured bacterium]